MPRIPTFADPLQSVLEQWTVGALVSNLLWTRGLGAAAIAGAQAQRLADCLAHARAHSPFYRTAWKHLPAGPLELAALPVVTKSALMQSFDDWCTDRAIRRREVETFLGTRAHIGERFRGRYVVWTSSGTTGTPGVFVQDDAALAVYDALVAVQLFEAVAPAAGWPASPRQRRAALVTADSDHFAGIASWRRQAHHKPWLDMASFPVTAPLPALVAALNDHDPGFVASYPTVLTLLAQEQAAGRLRLRPTALWSGGEALSPAAQAMIEDAFACPLHNEYGASECLSIGYACRLGGVHVSADWVVLEPVDRDFRPTPPGQLSHTVLLTNLANAVQPIVRYDLGDRVRARVGPCPCGSTLPAFELAGRTADIVELATASGAHVRLPPLALATVVEDAARLYRFQIAQEGPSSLALRAADGDRAQHACALRALRDYLAAQGLANVAVRLDPTPPREGRDGKLRQVIVRRASNRAIPP